MRGQNNQYNNQYYGNQSNNQNNQGGYYYSKNNNPNQTQKNKFLLFNQYDQNGTNDEESGKKKNLIIIIVCSIVAILLLILLFKACSRKSNKLSCEEDYKAFGDETYGYVCVPSDWVNFKDEDAERGIRYSDINADYILTLDVEKTEDKSAKAYADEVQEGLTNYGLNASTSKTTLQDYDAYKVVASYDDDLGINNLYVVVYFFETKDGKTRYIGLEGVEKTDDFEIIPSSFALKK